MTILYHLVMKGGGIVCVIVFIYPCLCVYVCVRYMCVRVCILYHLLMKGGGYSLCKCVCLHMFVCVCICVCYICVCVCMCVLHVYVCT